VTWIGLAVTSDDLAADGFDDRLLGLSDERMPQGALCPFELLPAEDCAAARLERLRLADRGHVAVYSFAA
jgi:hypothetical protein